MKKSKYIFIILAIVYAIMGLMYPFDILTIGDNLLFALSASALLISTSDVFSKVSSYLCIENAYYAELKTTTEFLDLKIQQGLTNTRTMNVRNVNENIKELIKGNYKFCHPNNYNKRLLIKILNNISLILFVLGITAFIIVPFLRFNIEDINATPIITIFAFTAMALSLFMDEIIIDKQNDMNILLNEKQILIQAEYPDFQMYFQTHMFYRNDLIATQELSKDNIPDEE